MRDNLNPRDGDSGNERPRRGFDPAASTSPVSDREVPLDVTSTADVINRWLDGELAEPTTLRGEAARHVEFWRRIGEETDRRRRMMTPAHLPSQIMAALEASAPLQTLKPWYRRTVELSASAALAAAAGLLALGALIGALLRVS